MTSGQEDTTMTTRTVDIHGDILTIHWTGSVWESPSCGAQFGSPRDAMRVEVRAYLLACGERGDALEAEVEQWLDEMV